jgi:hypothetical protein
MTRPRFRFSSWQRIQLFWVRHPSMDAAIALSVLIAWALSATLGGWPLALTGVPSDARRTTYQVIATVAATMGGFTLTSISILVNLLRTPMTTLDRLLPVDDKRRVGGVFLAVLPWLLGLFALALASVLTDSNVMGGYWLLQIVVVGTAIAATSSIGRVVWVLRRLLAISTD